VPEELGDERRKLGAALKWIRRERGIAQHVVAQQLGITVQSYRHFEAGRRGLKADALPGLARLFGMSMADLVGRWEALATPPARAAEDADVEVEQQGDVLTELRAIRRILERLATHLGAGDRQDAAAGHDRRSGTSPRQVRRSAGPTARWVRYSGV